MSASEPEADGARAQVLDLLPIELPKAFPAAPPDGEARNAGVGIAQLDFEVGEFTDRRAVGGDDRTAEDIGEEQEQIGALVENFGDGFFGRRHLVFTLVRL